MISSTNKVLFLTGLFPSEIRGELINNSKGNTQFAADALQWSIVKGLSFYYRDLKILNFPYVGSFPLLYKYPTIPTLKFNPVDLDAISVGYMNIMGLKNFDIYYKVRKYILDWVEKTEGKKIILIYAAFLPFIRAAISIKHLNEDVKICLILPDLIEFINTTNSFVSKFMRKQTSSLLEKSYNEIDAFVLLSRFMVDKLPIKNKKWVVMEGIFDSTNITVSNNDSTEKDKFILYSGSLAKRYGILNLVNAFMLLTTLNVRLVICGDGDAKDEILNAAKLDERIIFKGSLDRPEVLRLQRESILLVNPRTSEGEFTKYSFPSKTMEYLASGVPTLLYRLPGIPEEYYDYCYSLEDSSIDSLARMINDILNLKLEVRKQIGESARKFILEQKNAKVQCNKIYKLFEN